MAFLHGLRKKHLVLPTQDTTILPWAGKLDTHAYMVEEMEAELSDCTWAEAALRPAAPTSYDEDDDVERVQVKLRPSVAGSEEAIKPGSSSWRYRNKLLGRKGTHPEHPMIPSFSWFCASWDADEEARKCVVRRHLPFAKCDSCALTRRAIRDTRDHDMRVQLSKVHARHVSLMNKERGVYWAHRDLARRFPSKHLSLCIDGADQSDHALPHVQEKSHTSSEAYKAKVHVTGVIAHGRDTYVYTCPSHVKFGHNMTIQAIWDTIVDIQRRDGQLPENLYLQLDNTSRQNKGRFLTAFSELLVAAGLFKHIKVCFLPVGHTHEDIDQFFSRIAIRLRKYDAWCRKELAFQIRESYTTKEGRKPLVFHWDSVAHISGWFKGKNSDGTKVAPRIDMVSSGWMEYRHLKITPGAKAGTAVIQFRKHLSEVKNDPWTGLHAYEEHYSCLKTTPGEFFEALKKRTIPDASRTKPCQRFLDNRETGIKKMRAVYGKTRFTDEAYDDCLTMIGMEGDTSPIPFHWKASGISAITRVATNISDSAGEDNISDSDSDAGEDKNDPSTAAADDHESDDDVDPYADPWWRSYKEPFG